MKFWQSFSKKSIKKQFLFSLFLFAILVPIAIWDASTQVSVKFYDVDVYIKSDKYSMSVPYDIIDSAELADLADPGERVDYSYDNDVLRAGVWYNETWGEYHIAANLNASNCVVLHLNDGRTFVFSGRNNNKTVELYNELLTHIN